MKKILTAGALLLMAVGVSAQEPVSLTPKKGDWMVGVDVVPLLKTVGGTFKSTEEVPVGGRAFDGVEYYMKPNVSVLAKYMVSDHWGLKLNLGVMVDHDMQRSYVGDDYMDYIDPAAGALVEDSRTVTNTGISLKFGGEYRIGSRRVQGIAGVGVLFAASTYKADYKYGNTITGLNRTPTSTFGGYTDEYPQIPAGYRITAANWDGPQFNAGIYGSIGAEWMMTDQLALGAEVSLQLVGTFGRQAYVKSEGYNWAYNRVDTRTDLVSPGHSGIRLSTDNIGTALYLGFYF